MKVTKLNKIIKIFFIVLYVSILMIITPSLGATEETNIENNNESTDYPISTYAVGWTGGNIAATTYSSSETINLSGSVTLTGKITINSGATLTIQGKGTITRGSSYSGVMFQVNDGGTLIIKGSTGNNNDIVINGGSRAECSSVISVSESIQLTNVTIKNNYVHPSTNGDTSKSRGGGAIYVTNTTDANSVVKLTNCCITNCRAVDASAIYLNDSGGATVTIDRTIIENCQAIDKGITSSYGGLIRTNGSGKYKTTISDSVIRNNTSFSFGGGFYWNANTAQAMLTIEDTHIIGNSAGLRGGGIFLEGNNISIKASTGTPTEALVSGGIPSTGITGTIIQGNHAGDYGGGLCFKTYSNNSDIFVEETTVTLSENVIINGNTSANGAGVAFMLDSTRNYVDGAKFNFNINGSNITNNVSTSSGGAIYIRKARADYITETNVISGALSSNQAVNGGAICVTLEEGLSNVGEDIINIGTSGGNNEQLVIKNNEATIGGAFYITSGQLNLYCAEMNSNKADETGGAVYVKGGEVNIYGGQISYNNAQDGGAIYISNGDFLITSGEITKNNASKEGGAVYVNGGSITIGLEGCTVENSKHVQPATHPNVTENVAVYGGGGFMTDGTMTMYCGTLINNSSNNAGTGDNVYMNGGTFELAGGSVGEETNPGIVLVGGELKDTREEEIEENKITMVYHACLGDGVADHKVSVTIGKYVNVPAAQKGWVKEGYTMVGWTELEDTTVRTFDDYKSVGMAIKVEDPDLDKQMHYYAVWAKTPGIITYNLDGGTITGSNDTSYDYSVVLKNIKLISPEKPYYTFKGWELVASKDTITNWETYYPENATSAFYSVENPEEGLDLNIGTHFGDITLTGIYEPIVVNLEITVNNNLEPNQSYVLELSGTPSNGNNFITQKIAVITNEHGQGSVTVKKIPVGKYTVSLKDNWSWRYELAEENISNATNMQIDNSKETHSVTFDRFILNNSFWLNGYDYYIKR